MDCDYSRQQQHGSSTRVQLHGDSLGVALRMDLCVNGLGSQEVTDVDLLCLSEPERGAQADL